jgi:hypothetical protein
MRRDSTWQEPWTMMDVLEHEEQATLEVKA